MNWKLKASITVAGDGYEWHERPLLGDFAVLVMVLRKKYGPEGRDDRKYNPFLTEPGLFRTFARLERTPEAVLAFANQYGEIHDVYGMGLNVWRIEARKMRTALAIWDAICDGRRESLERYVTWSTSGALQFGQEVIGYTWENDAWETARNGGYRIGDLNSPALDILAAAIRTSGFGAALYPVRGPNGSLELQISAEHLTAVMWTQLALAVLENKQYRECRFCGRIFELSPEVARSDKLFCKHTCRVKFSQHRRTKARRMRKEGVKLQEIARQLGADRDTVKRWLGEEK